MTKTCEHCSVPLRAGDVGETDEGRVRMWHCPRCQSSFQFSEPVDPFTEPRLVTLRQKVIELVRKAPQAPNNSMSLGMLLLEHCSPDEMGLFDDLENAVGEEMANNWFAGVLSESGRYTTDDDGNVIPN